MSPRPAESSELAERTGITRAGLYKALAENGNPSIDTMENVLHAMGLRLSITPIVEDKERAMA